MKRPGSRLAFALASALLLVPVVGFAQDNPMKRVGEIHNTQLDCLRRHAEPGVSPLKTLLRHCGFEPNMPIREFLATYRPLVEADPSIPLAQRMAPFRDRYTEYEFGYFARIDAVAGAAADATQADAMFAALESEATANLDLRTFAGQTILGALSVARHSLRYWQDNGVSEGDVAAQRWPRWLKTIVVVVADVGGYIGPRALGADHDMAAHISSAASSGANDLIP